MFFSKVRETEFVIVIHSNLFPREDIVISYSHAEHFLKPEFDHSISPIDPSLKIFFVGNNPLSKNSNHI